MTPGGTLSCWGLDRDQRISSAISTETLDHRFRSNNKNEFEEFREICPAIEETARRKSPSVRVELNGTVLKRTVHIPH
jgi:hypothetical protein